MVSLVFQQHFIILLAKCLPSYAVETTMLETWRCLDISTIDVLLQHCLTDSKSSTERNGKLALIGLSAQSCCTSFGIDYDGVSKSAMLLLQVLQGDKTDRNSFSSNSIQFLSGLLQGHSKFSAFDDNTGMAEASERFQVYLAIQEAWWNDQYSQSGEVNLYSEAMETFVDIFVQSSRKLRNVVIPCLLQAITRSTQHMDGDEDKIDYNTDTNRLVLLECLLLFYDSNAANGSDSYNDDYQTKHAVDAILYSFEMNCMDDGEMSNIFLTILTRHIQSNRSNLIASALFMQLYQTLVMYQPSLIVLYFKTACQHLSSFPHEVQLQLSKNIVEFLSLQQSTSCGAQQDLHQFLLSWRLEGHIYSVVDETISQHIETQIFANLTDDKNCLALSKLLHQDSVTLQIDLERWLLLYTALQCSGDDSEGHSLVHLEELLHVWTNPIAVNSSPSFPPQRTGICKVLSMVFNFLLPLQSRSLYKLLPAESIFAQLHRCLSLLYWFLNSTAKSLILIVETTDKQIDLVTPIRVLQAACSIVGYGIRQCVKLNPRKSSAPTALLAFSEAIQDAKNVDQNLPISLVDFSRQAYSVLLPSTNMQQQSNDRSDMAPGDDRMDSVNRDDEEMANQDNDEQIAEELYSSESCIPTSLLLNHFEKQLTTWFTIMEGSSTSGKCLPLIWLETQLLALTYTITALHHSIQISYQENQASGLTLESWQFLVNGYMRLMSSTTLKQLSSLFERSEATSNSYKPPKRNKLRFDMNQYLGHHSLAHVMYLLYDPLVLFDEASPSTFTLANSTLPESDEDDDDLRIMAFQVRRTTASIDPIQLQSQLVAGANNTYASFDTSTSMFRLSKALTASIRNCLLQCTTVQSSALEELFRPIASNYYQAGHRSFASKKSEEENIFHLSSMQQQLQSAYLLLLKDATRSIITQQEEDQPISIAKNDLRSYMLYLTKDLMQSIIRGIPLRNLKVKIPLPF